MATPPRRCLHWPFRACASALVAACALMVALATAPAALAQPVTGARIQRPAPGVVQELELRDGSRLYGQVESFTDDEVVFRTVGGARLTVPRLDIASLREAKGRVEGERFMAADANATRLFFGPTARSLPRGQGYLGVYEFVLPFLQVGVTDHLSIGAGTPLFFGSGAHPFWFTPKFQVYGGGAAQAAVGVIHLTNLEDEGSLGIAYGVTTVGSADRAVSIGAGWAYSRVDDDEGNAAVAMVAGEYRVHPRVKLITENYAFSGGGILTGGVRFLGDHLSADLALVAPVGADEFVVGPLVNFVWTFGQGR